VAVMSFVCMFGGLGAWALLTSSDRTAVLSAFVICISLVVTLGLLLCWHLYLACTGQTTVEFYYNAHARANVFDLGSWRLNLTSALGEPSWRWLLLTGGPPRPGDGVHMSLSSGSLFDAMWV
jgi:hypothetical protein